MINKFVLMYIFSTLIVSIPASFLFSMGYRENEINGNSLYKDENFVEAAAEYSEGLGKKADFDLYYNRGVSYYKLGQYDKSFSDFEDAGTYANSEKDQIKAVYNAGNSNFMMAETEKTKNPDLALEHYTKAVNHFERVLQLEADDPDASYNLELSRIRLDELKQRQNEDKQNDDKKSDGQQDGDQKDSNQQENNQQKSDQQDNDQQGNNQQKSDQQDNDQQGSNQQKSDQQDNDQQGSNQQNGDQQDSANQKSSQQQEENKQSENSNSAYSPKGISPKDILNEEARRLEAMQALINSGSGEPVDKDW